MVWYDNGNLDPLDTTTDDEIFLCDGVTTTQLTDNNDIDKYPQVRGNSVVWEEWDGNDFEIYLYDGAKTIKLPSN